MSDIEPREPLDGRDPLSPLTEQEAKAYHYASVWRMNQMRIAEKMEISNQRVSQLLAQARAKMPPVDLTELRRSVIDRYEHIAEQALLLAEKEGAPVTAGKDGDVLYDPETNEVVRDYGLRLSSLAELRKTLAELRKFEGLDRPAEVKVESTVRYVVEGVNMGDLT